MNNKKTTPNSGDGLSHEERAQRCAELGIVVRKSPPVDQARQAGTSKRAQPGTRMVSGE